VRIVCDPNVLVSAAVATGVSAELLDRWLLNDRPFELVVCPMLLGELSDVLMRPKFRRWITAEQVAAFVELLDAKRGRGTIPPVTGDAKDDYLAALHRRAKADLLVSGVPDLTELQAADVSVLPPGELLRRLESVGGAPRRRTPPPAGSISPPEGGPCGQLTHRAR
jgi:uncharacterized protein